MTSRLSRICGMFLIAILSVTSLPLQIAQAQTITPSELRDAILKSAAERQKDLTQVRSFFADPTVRTAIAKGGMDADRIQKAVSTLSADELARLSARTARIQADFAAGALSNQELTYIVVGLGAAVLVLVVVAA